MELLLFILMTGATGLLYFYVNEEQKRQQQEEARKEEETRKEEEARKQEKKKLSYKLKRTKNKVLDKVEDTFFGIALITLTGLKYLVDKIPEPKPKQKEVKNVTTSS